MTELVSQSFLPPRDEYAQITDLATRLAGTDFVPSAYRHKDGAANPPAVIAALLTGRELGLQPMESLRSIHMVDGRPTLSAEATMKLAMQAGHLLIVTESTRTSATVRYRNAAWPETEEAREIVFDYEDAEAAELTTGKRGAMYRKYPRAMLRSRAITEAARAGGLLSSAAAAYTTEELADEDDDAVSEEAVVVSISPDEDDVEYAVEVEDELDVRRDLKARAQDAYRSAAAADEERALTAWAAFTGGLPGPTPGSPNAVWVDSDLDVLRLRVEELEGLSATIVRETPDDDDGGEGPPDDGHDAPSSPPSTPAEPEPEPEPDPEPDEGETQAERPPPSEIDPEAVRLGEHYDRLNVTDVSDLLRHGETGPIKTDAGPITLRLPRSGPDGVLDAFALVADLERSRDGGARKTVEGVLESVGWREPDSGPSRDETRTPSSGSEPSGHSVPDDAPAPETASRDVEDDGRAPMQLLDDWRAAYEELRGLDEGRAEAARKVRRDVGVTTAKQWLEAPRETLVNLTVRTERLAAELRDDA